MDDGWRLFVDRSGWHPPPYGETVEWRDYGIGGKPFVARESEATRHGINLEWRPLRYKLIELGLCK